MLLTKQVAGIPVVVCSHCGLIAILWHFGHITESLGMVKIWPVMWAYLPVVEVVLGRSDLYAGGHRAILASSNIVGKDGVGVRMYSE